MRFAQRVIKGGLLLFPEKRVERILLAQIKIRHIAEQCRRGGLAVAVDQGNTIALDCEILGKVDRQGRLADTSLEVLDGHDTAWIVGRSPGPGAEQAPHIIELGKRVTNPAIILGSRRRRKTPVLFRIADCSGRPPNQVSGLSDRESGLTAFIRARAAR